MLSGTSFEYSCFKHIFYALIVNYILRLGACRKAYLNLGFQPLASSLRFSNLRLSGQLLPNVSVGLVDIYRKRIIFGYSICLGGLDVQYQIAIDFHELISFFFGLFGVLPIGVERNGGYILL